MTTIDRQGNVVSVGDKIRVEFTVIDIVQDGRTQSVIGHTAIPSGTTGYVYSLPVCHGSQIDKVQQ